MRDDPCFNCTLPDCDETSPECKLHKLYRSAISKTARKSRDVTPLEREGRRAFYAIWRLEHEAKISEARFSSPATQQEASFEGFFEG